MGGSSEAQTVLAETDNTLVVRKQLRNCKELAVTENHGQAPGLAVGVLSTVTQLSGDHKLSRFPQL